MSFPKRTMLYLARKKGKTLILFLLLFTVSAFVLPYKWSYTVAQAMKAQDIDIPSETESPGSEEDVRHFSTRYRYRRIGSP